MSDGTTPEARGGAQDGTPEGAQGGPLARYRAMVRDGRIIADDAQRAAVEKLQFLHARLTRPRTKGRSILGLFGFIRSGEGEVAEANGLYLYGGVGRGKSMLMDLFFDDAPTRPKRRVHFHAFMQEVHRAIDAARNRGVEDPIKVVAADVADSAALLCFDEMQVTDIADAMILGRLFEALFARDVTIVVTSNRHPQDLYKDGLNRQLFLPFIDMLCQRLDVHQLDGPTDFRLARLRGLEVYHAPLGPGADAAMDRAWDDLTGGMPGAPLDLPVQGRTVRLPLFRGGVGRASFEDLCAKPLGAADYLAIVEAVDTLLVDRIPMMSRARFDQARRFVTLVDTIYEARVHFLCSADAEPDDLYTSGDGAFEFERTASRLWEMRSADWAEVRKSS